MRYVCIKETASSTFKVGDICDMVFVIGNYNCPYYMSHVFKKHKVIMFDEKHFKIHFKPLNRKEKLKRIL